jgi:uncharacterized protein (DUF2141 family)
MKLVSRLFQLAVILVVSMGLAGACMAQEPAPAKLKITVTVTGIRYATGNIRVGLYSDANTVVQGKVVEIDPKTLTATAVFENVAVGTYGVGVIHDENKNDKLDFNEDGVPVEGYGHSNNPEKRPGPPNWDEYRFVVEKDTALEIRLIYWL